MMAASSSSGPPAALLMTSPSSLPTNPISCQPHFWKARQKPDQHSCGFSILCRQSSWNERNKAKRNSAAPKTMQRHTRQHWAKGTSGYGFLEEKELPATACWWSTVTTLKTPPAGRKSFMSKKNIYQINQVKNVQKWRTACMSTISLPQKTTWLITLLQHCQSHDGQLKESKNPK